MTYLKGYVDHIRFRNEDNGYTVLSLDVDGDEETVVGLFPFLNEGEYISMEGDYVGTNLKHRMIDLLILNFLPVHCPIIR